MHSEKMREDNIYAYSYELLSYTFRRLLRTTLPLIFSLIFDFRHRGEKFDYDEAG